MSHVHLANVSAVSNAASVLPDCPSGAPARSALHHGMRCHCGAPASTTTTASGADSSDDASTLASGWGLPTHACPATSYLLEQYPVRHREWLEQGRFLVHCSTSGGFGDYLRSLPSVVILSMLTELALVLECDIPTFDPSNKQREQKLHKFLSRVFTGPHFDWSRRVKLDGRARAFAHAPLASDARNGSSSMGANRSKVAEHTVINLPDHQMRRHPRSLVSMRVYSNAFTHARRLIKFNRDALLPKLGAFVEHPNEMDVDSCLLRYLFAPSTTLTRAANDALSLDGAIRMPQSGTALARVVATHIRVGDSVFRSAEWDKHAWFRSEEVRDSPFLRDVPLSMRALLRASEYPSSLAQSTPSTSLTVACLPCVVVSDHPAVTTCAKAALDSPITTPGLPVHLLASARDAVSDDRNILKIFLDWWLLARALVTVQLGAQSSFGDSALNFKLVSSADGLVSRPMNQSAHL
jgi:hypothetical protein